ncbi:MAG: putative membrane protein YedE/YeeE [Chlamydiales bacterium]|jgi:uncharacterized membrane protein YedE/YeeE
MENFTPWSSFFGGVLIGLASLMVLYQGFICGISGIFKNALQISSTDPWRYLFLSGLILGGVFLRYYYSEAMPFQFTSTYLSLISGGLFVGFGASIGGGCTSGHGVCGMGRLSMRSFVASLTFLLFGILTASLMHYFSGAEL